MIGIGKMRVYSKENKIMLLDGWVLVDVWLLCGNKVWIVNRLI